MAVVLILEPIFEADFLDCSHGFRRGRKAHDALEEIRANLKEGRTAVYDADLKGYFDTIPHDKLMACVRMRITDSAVLDLIRGWLRAPIIEIDEKTGPKQCFKPTPKVVDDLNTFLRGWSNYFGFGYPRKAFLDLSYYTRQRMVTHLNRRSQRKYHRSKGMSHYQYLQELELQRL